MKIFKQIWDSILDGFNEIDKAITDELDPFTYYKRKAKPTNAYHNLYVWEYAKGKHNNMDSMFMERDGWEEITREEYEDRKD